MKNITIDGEHYEIDVLKAIRSGHLKKITKIDPKEVKGGNIYRHREGDNFINPFMVVKVLYNSLKSYQLVCLSPYCPVNSGSFFDELHTVEEIAEYLSKENMELVENFGLEEYLERK